MSPSREPARVSGAPLDLRGFEWPADFPARADPSKLALVHETREMSYGALDGQASAFTTLMRIRNIKPGGRVAYLGRNSDIYFSVVFGAFRAGVVLVPLNWRYAIPELRFVLEDCAPGLIICDAEFHSVAAAAAPHIPLLAVEGPGGLREALETLEPSSPEAQSPDAPAVLMYTSGTTGKPKGVCLTHRMYGLARQAEITSPDYADWTTDEVLLSPMPNFHMGALSWIMGGLRRGLTCVVTGDTTARGLLALCRRHGVARTFIVPTVLRALLEEMRSQGVSLPRLKQIQYGAAPMDVALLQASIEQLGCSFLQHYGMTENTGTATRLSPADHDPARPHLLRSIGKPQVGLTLEIRRPDGTVAARGEPGEIWIQSPTVMLGYWRREEATQDAIVDGWYRSGDGGVIDDAGFLYLTDRIKEMIVSGGENIYPVEVEEALRSHPAVLDTAVFGLPDAHWGEAVTAAVEFRPEQQVAEAELAAHMRGRIAAYKSPKRYLLGVTLPRTATGKVQRSEMRRRALAAEPDAG